MADYTKQLATAEKLITKFGGPMTVIKSGGQSSSSLSSEAVAGTSFTVTAARVGTAIQNEDGSATPSYTNKFFIKGDGNIEKNDLIEDEDSVRHIITELRALKPASDSINILWTAITRTT